jgi:hypothetical protein
MVRGQLRRVRAVVVVALVLMGTASACGGVGEATTPVGTAPVVLPAAVV